MPAAPTRRRRVSSRLSEAGESVRQVGDKVTGAVGANPVPAALIGAGLAWLLLGSRVRSAASSAAEAATESELLERARERFEQVSGRVSSRLAETAGSMKDAFTSGAEDAAEAVRDGAGRLGEYASAVGSTIGSGAAAVGERAKRGYDISREGVSTAWHQHPLTSGVALLAAGVAIGMLLPGTARENAALGRQADAVKRRVKTAGRRLASRGKEVAGAVAGALKEEAEGEGLGTEEVARKVRRIAGHVQEATVNAARQARLNPASVLSESGEDEKDE